MAPPRPSTRTSVTIHRYTYRTLSLAARHKYDNDHLWDPGKGQSLKANAHEGKLSNHINKRMSTFPNR